MPEEKPEEKTILDKAKDLAIDVKEKVSELVGDNEEKITGAIDKAGEFVDDKTKHKYTDKIDRAQEAAKSAVSKVAGTSSDDGGATGESGASGESGTADTDAPAAKPPATTGDDTPEGGPTDPVPDA